MCRALLLVFLVLPSACGCSMGTAPADPSAAAPPPAVSARNEPVKPLAAATLAFCAFGGQGVLGAGMRSEDYIRVVAVVDLTVTSSSPTAGVALDSIALRDDNGVVEAAMRAPISVVRVEPIPAATTWETAMHPGGTPFDGTLAPGRTRLRIEAWLTTHPHSYRLRAHVVLVGSHGPIEADGAVDGEWPTG
jgi:hypothetical protein